MEEISHKEIYERLVQVEQKVDAIDANTKNMVGAFNAASGAFTVLEWLAKAVKPILIVGAFFGALYAAISHKVSP
jgi:hypothetical protein